MRNDKNSKGEGHKDMKIEGEVKKEVFYDIITQIIYEIGRGRVDETLGLDDSIMEKYTLNSIDLMDVMIAIREKCFDENHSFDVSNFMSKIYEQYDDGIITVRAIGNVVSELYNESH